MWIQSGDVSGVVDRRERPKLKSLVTTSLVMNNVRDDGEKSEWRSLRVHKNWETASKAGISRWCGSWKSLVSRYLNTSLCHKDQSGSMSAQNENIGQSNQNKNIAKLSNAERSPRTVRSIPCDFQFGKSLLSFLTQRIWRRLVTWTTNSLIEFTDWANKSAVWIGLPMAECFVKRLSKSLCQESLANHRTSWTTNLSDFAKRLKTQEWNTREWNTENKLLGGRRRI